MPIETVAVEQRDLERWIDEITSSIQAVGNARNEQVMARLEIVMETASGIVRELRNYLFQLDLEMACKQQARVSIVRAAEGSA